METEEIIEQEVFVPNKLAIAVVLGGGVIVSGLVAFLAYRHWREKNTVVVPAEPQDVQMSLFETNDVTVKLETFPALEPDISPESVVKLIETAAVYDEPSDSAVVNVFTIDDAEWDYEAELKARSKHEPYIIHRDEFFADEMDFRQTTVTYYEGDDILADENETPIYNHAGLLGDLRFGHGSGDNNVVYIRNEVMNTEWEVLRHTGSYQIEVIGLHVQQEHERGDLRHSAVPKFRRD